MAALADSRVEATVPAQDLEAARLFYEDRLGLRPTETHGRGVDVVYECGAGTRLVVYAWAGTTIPKHTCAHFVVDDVAATVRELRERGVEFDAYDLPNLRTVDGVATVDGRHFAWFKDPDLNVIGIHD